MMAEELGTNTQLRVAAEGRQHVLASAKYLSKLRHPASKR